MKTSILLVIFVLWMFSNLSIEAKEDSEAIQQRMTAIEIALQQMAEVSTQGAQVVQHLSMSVEKLASDYASSKSEVSQRLTAIEGELESLKSTQQKPLISKFPQMQKEKTTEGINPISPQRAIERMRSIEKTVKLISTRNVYYSPIHRVVHYTQSGPQVMFYTVHRIELGSYRVVRQEATE